MDGVTQLVVGVYASVGEADDAREQLEGVEVQDAAIVTRTPSGVELRQTRQRSIGEGVVAGGTVGLLIGLLAGIPAAAAAGGVLAGGAWGARDTGIPNSDLRELAERIHTGESMLCVLVAGEDAESVRASLAAHDAGAAGVAVLPP
jgi:uncharacterized membrane protein